MTQAEQSDIKVLQHQPGNEQSSEAARVLFRPIIDEFWQAELPKIKQLSNETITSLVNERIGILPPHRIEIMLNGEVIANIPRQHYMFQAVLRLMEARDNFGSPLNIALVGPTGTGKTRMCINAAQALKEEFILQPFNPQTTKSELMGYMDANGHYVESPFYKAFKNGKLFIADEFDAANPAVATVLNAAVSNRVITFPSGETVTAHEEFRCVFCMNTFGTGGDDRYTGRNRLDLATLDRMVFVVIPIDPGLEAALIGIPDVPSPSADYDQGEHFRDQKEILNRVINIRGIIEKEGLRYSISPRATIHSCALHRAGFSKDWIEKTCIWRAMPDTERKRVEKLAA
jgi:hypothetical protein